MLLALVYRVGTHWRNFKLMEGKPIMEEALYYLQDSRNYIGNDMVWWVEEGNGYTTDLSKAATYTSENANRMHTSRKTDKPWLKEYIDSRSRPAVDMQYVSKPQELAFMRKAMEGKENE